MFLTRPSYSVWLPPFEGFEDCHAWSAIQLSAVLPWFLVEMEGKPSSKRSACATLLVSRLEMLTDLLESFGPDDRALKVLAFFPPAVSGHSSWDPIELEELWQASLRQDQVWLLQTTCGKMLLEPPMEFCANEVTRDSLLYRRPAR